MSPHVFLGSLCAGLAAATFVRAPSALVAAFAVALALAYAWQLRAAVLAASLLLAGFWWGSVRLDALDRSLLVHEVGRTAPAVAVVSGPARRGAFALRVPAVVERFDRRHVREPVLLELPLGRSPPQGARLSLIARVQRPRAGDGGFDEREWLRRRGVHVVAEATSWRVIGRRGGIAGLGDRLRAHVGASIAPALDGERRAVVAGIVLGEDEGLLSGLRDAFRASGLYHLLAVSGQNVAFIVGGVLLLAWAAGLPRWVGEAGALAAIGGYVLAVGWQPSVVRAGVAGALASLAWLAARPRDRWRFLLLGALVLLAWNPWSARDPGFQLSFAAVAAIFVAVPRLRRRLDGYPVPGALADVVAVSVACGLATAPILWLHFGAVPLFSVFANALAAPAVAPVLGLGLVAAAAEPLAPAAAAAIAWMAGWPAAYLAWCARLVGGLPFAEIDSGSGAALLGAVGVVVLALLRTGGRSRLAVAGAACALAAILAGWRLAPAERLPPPGGLRVTALDVGQGDAVLLETPAGNVLVDQGPPEGRAGEQLAGMGVRRLALLVLTHPQRDHVGGAADVLERVEVDRVLDPALAARSPYTDAALAAARRRGVPVDDARRGAEYRLGRLRLRVLWPEDAGSAAEDPNENAIVLLASYGSLDVLLTADAESSVVLPLRPPQVEILKVAHHGSADPLLPELLRLTRPRVALVSVGARNDYGHPAPSTLAALAAVDLRLLRTDRDGRVAVESDGSGLLVRRSAD
ncbi:MAG: DNA internalization-related competence protein ComEC/Rec2 [Actinomycetota bacterium]|nr:DNA internalization-related competence protein ComEC/Rec2 [Actinomycetota bacterium]